MHCSTISSSLQLHVRICEAQFAETLSAVLHSALVACSRPTTMGLVHNNNRAVCTLQLSFPVLAPGQEASPASLHEATSIITINIFDEVITHAAMARAARSAQAAAKAAAGEHAEQSSLV
jgi:hypothetical protein